MTEDNRPDDEEHDNLAWSRRTPKGECCEDGEINWRDWIWWVTVAVLTLVTAVGRFTVPSRPASAFSWPASYEAIAHCTVALLIGLTVKYRWCWWVAAALIVLETLCFTFQ